METSDNITDRMAILCVGKQRVEISGKM